MKNLNEGELAEENTDFPFLVEMGKLLCGELAAQIIGKNEVLMGDEIVVRRNSRGIEEFCHGVVAKISKAGGLQNKNGAFLLAPREIHGPSQVYLIHREAKPLPKTTNSIVDVRLFAPHVAYGRPGLYRYDAMDRAWYGFGSSQKYMPGDFRDWKEVHVEPKESKLSAVTREADEEDGYDRPKLDLGVHGFVRRDIPADYMDSED